MLGSNQQQARLQMLLRACVGCVAAALVLLFLVTSLGRIRCNCELEQLEGYMLLSLMRVMHGQSLYPAPNIHFMPYMYPPGYFYASAWLGKLLGTGASFVTLRLTSILSTLGCFGVIYLLVWKEVRRHLPALAAVGVYAGCYAVCEEWFDLGRLDSFYVFLLLLAVYATRRLHPAIAAVFWLLAFTTKQSILPVAVLLLCFHWERRLRTLLGLTVLGSGALAIVALLDKKTAGWFYFYVFTVPGKDADLLIRNALFYLPRDILSPLGCACLVMLAAVLLTRPNWKTPAARFYVLTLSIVLLCGFIRMHIGSVVNTEMPAYAILAVLFGICFSRMETWLDAHAGPQRDMASLLLLSTVLVQLVTSIYSPGPYIHYKEKQAVIATVIRQAKEVPGDVYFFEHPYYGVLAGRSEYADSIALSYVLGALGPGERRQQLQGDMADLVDKHLVSGLFLDNPDSVDQFNALAAPDPQWERWYPVRMHTPTTGLDSRPSWILLHCPLPAQEYGSASASAAPPAIQGCPAPASLQ